MPLYRISSIFQMTTVPTDLTAAAPHTCGWTEGFWSNAAITPLAWQAYAQKRANILGSNANMLGYRQQAYTISGNKVLPGGSTVFKSTVKGNAGGPGDYPNLGLAVSFSPAAGVNTTRLVFRGIMDDYIEGGEYQPTAVGKNFMTQFLNYVVTAANGFGFVGRDLSQVPQKVTSVQAGVLQTQGVIPGAVAGSTFVRFLKCVDDNGNPIKGSYLITAVGAGGYTLQGMNKTVTKANGLVRLDTLAFFPFSAYGIERLVSKKVGRPSQSYRGRASKRS